MASAKEKGKVPEEEGVEALLKKLQIAEKKKCVVIGSAINNTKVNPNQAIGKVILEKAAYVDGIVQTLGRIWC